MATKALDRKQRAYPDAPHLWLPQLDAAYACRMPQGKYAQAEPFAKQALDIARETYGTRHPDYALALRDHGTATASMGDASGIDALEEAVPILEGVFGKRSEQALRGLNNLASALATHGRFDEAVATRRIILERLEAKTSSPRRRVITLHLLGVDLFAAGRAEAAVEALERAAAELGQLPDPERNPQRAAGIAFHRGLAYERLQRFGEAREQLQIALPLLERVYGASDGETLRAMGHLAWLQWRSGDHSAAKRLEDVVEQLVATSVSAARADVEGLWARVVWTRDRARGRALAERALQALQSHAPHMRHEAAALEQWLHDQPR